MNTRILACFTAIVSILSTSCSVEMYSRVPETSSVSMGPVYFDSEQDFSVNSCRVTRLVDGREKPHRVYLWKATGPSSQRRDPINTSKGISTIAGTKVELPDHDQPGLFAVRADGSVETIPMDSETERWFSDFCVSDSKMEAFREAGNLSWLLNQLSLIDDTGAQES